MPRLQILAPNDQPTGKLRLLQELRECLASDDYNSFLMSIAFVRVGPLIRLQSEIESWLANGKTIDAIWGINHKGTSEEAIAFALHYFTKTHVLFSGESVTFHPKMYLFFGPERCRFYVGSHNLTVGGTETNWEAGIRLDALLPEDQGTADEMVEAWRCLAPLAVELTPANFPDLLSSGLLLDESSAPARDLGAHASSGTGPRLPKSAFKFPKLITKPPSPLPPSAFAVKKSPRQRAKRPTARAKPQVEPAAAGLVIQIVPHHNGEVFLSKTAINQNPDFFGFPFTGKTTPKFSSNPAYPQRVPDPLVKITVYGPSDEELVHLPHFALNTVFYQTKAEIRITVPPDVVRNTPPYSLLLMRRPAEGVEYDYDMDIFSPGSPQFDTYLEVCNQTLPSGGKSTPRRMGWL